MLDAMGGKLERYFVPAVIGFAPFVLLLLTWAPEQKTPAQHLMLGLYVPLAAAEVFIAVVALREGLIGAMRNWSWPRVPTTALLILVAVAVGTALTAPNPAAARTWTIFWLLHLLFGFSVAHLCTKSLGQREVVRAYLAGFVAFAAATVVFYTQVTDPGFDWTHAWPAATHIRHFGYYATAMIAMALGLAATERRPVRLALLFLFNVGAFAFALWTGSRGSVIGVAGALLVGSLLVASIRRLIVWAGAVLSLALGAAIASLGPAPGPFMGFHKTISRTVESGDVSTGRTQMWLNVIVAIKKRPLFGYGENQMSTVAPFGTLGQTHEIILQVLLAWGLVGLACVAVLAIWFLMRSLPVVRRDAELQPAFMAMLALASLSLIDGSLFHVLPVSIFAACAGMIASRWLPEKASA